MAEKRLFKRTARRFRLHFGTGKTDTPAYTEDLSASGFFIKTNKITPPGSLLLVELQGPETAIKLECRVIWARKVPLSMFNMVKKCGMGILITKFISGENEYHTLYST